MEPSLQVSLGPDLLMLGWSVPKITPLPSTQLPPNRLWRFSLFNLFTPTLIHLVIQFKKYLLGSYHMPGAVLGTEERAENRFPTLLW